MCRDVLSNHILQTVLWKLLYIILKQSVRDIAVTVETQTRLEVITIISI